MKCFGITDVLFWHYLCTILALMYYSGIIDVLFHQWCYVFELWINCLEDLCMHSLIRYRRQYDISLDFVPSFLHKQLLSRLSLTFIFLPHLLAVKFYYHILLQQGKPQKTLFLSGRTTTRGGGALCLFVQTFEVKNICFFIFLISIPHFHIFVLNS